MRYVVNRPAALERLPGQRHLCSGIGTLARIKVERQSLHRVMVAAWLAWQCNRYSEDAGPAVAEIAARATLQGLLADPEPVLPSEWRATEKDLKAARNQPAGRKDSSLRARTRGYGTEKHRQNAFIR